MILFPLKNVCVTFQPLSKSHVDNWIISSKFTRCLLCVSPVMKMCDKTWAFILWSGIWWYFLQILCWKFWLLSKQKSYFSKLKSWLEHCQHSSAVSVANFHGISSQPSPWNGAYNFSIVLLSCVSFTFHETCMHMSIFSVIFFMVQFV